MTDVGDPSCRAVRALLPRPCIDHGLGREASGRTGPKIRGAFNGIVNLQAAIKRYLKEHNANPKPFVWTKPATEIFNKLARLPAPSA
jgi:hypothetical protein